MEPSFFQYLSVFGLLLLGALSQENRQPELQVGWKPSLEMAETNHLSQDVKQSKKYELDYGGQDVYEDIHYPWNFSDGQSPDSFLPQIKYEDSKGPKRQPLLQHTYVYSEGNEIIGSSQFSPALPVRLSKSSQQFESSNTRQFIRAQYKKLWTYLGKSVKPVQFGICVRNEGEM